MCGIVVCLNDGERGGAVTVDEVLSYAERLAHRGPDDTGVVEVPNGAILAHKRLSIVDLDKGHQPLQSADGKSWLVVNGEIYNHKELREHVDFADCQWLTQTDSEAVLHAVGKFGPLEGTRKLHGMFGFVLFGDGHFIAARDAIGIKPLFMGIDRHGNHWFSSELKAIIDVCPIIESVRPGTLWTPEKGMQQWFEPSWFLSSNVPTDEVDLKLLRTTFEEAVRKRMMADVAVGVALSGGLDSSIVAAVMCKIARADKSRWPNGAADIHSFSVGVGAVKDSPDLVAARTVAKHLGTTHHEKVFTPEEGFQCIDDVIYHLESYDASPIRSGCAYFLLCRLAAKHVKVMLTGEGADEVLAGYLYFAESVDRKAVHHEMIQKVKNLHGVQLQFHDRLAMAHSLEVRVPFLDVDFLNFVLTQFRPEDKFHGSMAGGRIEKWAFRQAFKGYIPNDVLWRQKEQFGDGVGYSWIDEVKTRTDALVTDAEFMLAKKKFPDDPPNTKEQFYNRGIFARHYPSKAAQATVQRWFPWSDPTRNEASARDYASDIHIATAAAQTLD